MQYFEVYQKIFVCERSEPHYTLGQKSTFYPEIPLILRKCEFCKNWDFRKVNFVKIEISEM